MAISKGMDREMLFFCCRLSVRPLRHDGAKLGKEKKDFIDMDSRVEI